MTQLVEFIAILGFPLRAPGTTFDLRRGTLREGWKSFVPKVRDIRSRRREYLENCRACPELPDKR